MSRLTRHLLHHRKHAEEETVTSEHSQPRVTTATRKATPDEHYVLTCSECDFTHEIPRDCSLPDVDFSVDPEAVEITCLYGGVFNVSLALKGLFTIAPTPATGAILKASIVDHMKPLHDHMLTHCDPLFLLIRQAPRSTQHTYSRQPAGSTFVRYSNTTGIDIVGGIDVSKAEIPGVS